VQHFFAAQQTFLLKALKIDVDIVMDVLTKRTAVL
jgi:hypothetical protein